jgi:CheY-like chemotaxis protein
MAGLPNRDYVVLEISDTGCGMSAQAQAKAFDPFYTTKSVGRGLGLAAVQGIVRSHGGGIHVISAPERGTTFRVFLPCERRLQDRKRSAPAPEETLLPEGHTLLLVEDEETLRLAVAMSLRKNGFSVLTAGDGRTALNLFREHCKDIDLILVDLTLPGISGAEVCREVRRISADVKIIFTSAYDRERMSAGFPTDEEAPYGFIRKPYRIAELVRTLHRTLRRRRALTSSTHT